MSFCGDIGEPLGSKKWLARERRKNVAPLPDEVTLLLQKKNKTVPPISPKQRRNTNIRDTWRDVCFSPTK